VKRTAAALRREWVSEMREINRIMRLVVDRWTTLATRTFDSNGWRKAVGSELPENDVEALKRLAGYMREVSRRAGLIETAAERRRAELEGRTR